MQHAGIFHMALSCWALVSFGPQVCKGYGSFTFFLIYILGGVSGNFASFLHTPDPTVGGTVSIILQFMQLHALIHSKIMRLNALINLSCQFKIGQLTIHIYQIFFK
jgi:membrane associated rhomboid family serine protease